VKLSLEHCGTGATDVIDIPLDGCAVFHPPNILEFGYFSHEGKSDEKWHFRMAVVIPVGVAFYRKGGRCVRLRAAGREVRLPFEEFSSTHQVLMDGISFVGIHEARDYCKRTASYCRDIEVYRLTQEMREKGCEKVVVIRRNDTTINADAEGQIGASSYVYVAMIGCRSLSYEGSV